MTQAAIQRDTNRSTGYPLPLAARTEELARRQLADQAYMQLRRIECEFHEGVLTLRGVVGSFFLKQIAQTVVGTVRGVEVIANHVEVEAVWG